jgi:hypothetical protein
MPVNDKHCAALHAFLSGRTEEHERLVDAMDPADANKHYSLLITAALIEMAEKRFIRDGKYVPQNEIIEYVAFARGKSDDFAEDVDPRVAERVLLTVLDQGDLDGIDNDQVVQAQLYMLTSLVHDEQFSDEELASLVEAARRMVNDALSAPE